MPQNGGESRGEPSSPSSRSLTTFRQSTELVGRRGKGVILIVQADPRQSEATADVLEEMGYRCELVDSGEAALEAVKGNHHDLVLIDLVLKGMSGLEVLRRAREINPDLALMVIAEPEAVESAVEAMKQGATDFLLKPFNLEELRVRVFKTLEVQKLRLSHREQTRQLVRKFPFDGIVGSSDAMRDVTQRAAQVAGTDATVLITGESGTGKEVIAEAIHKNSQRSTNKFLKINCAAFSPNIIESELFGHEKGAFTGAISQRKGVFEHCHRGTIFLDEVGDIPLETQVKLLRVLENRLITRVGSNDPISIDVRVICATHRHLEELVKEGKFREDLYYRVKVVTLHIPPLRERPQDIPPLVDYFLRMYSQIHGKHFSRIDPEAMAAFVAHPWKGNVRELRHMVESLIIFAPGPVITMADLPESIQQSRKTLPNRQGSVGGLIGLPLKEVERELIRATLSHVQGNRKEAAKLLGIGERTLYRKLKLHSLT
ncbi:MAG: sigma-54-dependent Fis family transcriptional regulator [Planctomycetes bacterium]|nr:sigma-54-dependent Fis family transcriptional regulator [Planctomycetota bacterium]